MPQTPQFSELLRCWRQGDKQAGDQLIAAAYDELHRLAAQMIKHERSDHTLQATGLVNELYVKLFASQPVAWQDRAHFFAVAARQLRRILVNHARDRRAVKRGAGAIRLSLSEANGMSAPLQEDVLAVDQALSRLEHFDKRAAQVIELRFFGGLQEKEAAAVLGISVPTLKRDWEFARSWLLTQLVPADDMS